MGQRLKAACRSAIEFLSVNAVLCVELALDAYLTLRTPDCHPVTLCLHSVLVSVISSLMIMSLYK